VTVFWDVGESPSEATLEYTVELPGDVADGDVVTFEGFVESGDGRHSITGDGTATVVIDVFQRVLERGTVTDVDIEVAVARDDVTPTEIDRLRRSWLEEN
jgi:hypothetical protein